MFEKVNNNNNNNNNNDDDDNNNNNNYNLIYSQEYQKTTTYNLRTLFNKVSVCIVCKCD